MKTERKRFGALLLLGAALMMATTQLSAKSNLVWQSDLGNGEYKNPIIYADYSDPDLVRVGNDYYMTASSFNAVPGLPILHSTDLVNWTLVNNALAAITPEEDFNAPAHGKAVWAPCIRFHEGLYYIYWGDPDYGVYVITASDPCGEWSKPHLVMAGKGIIDPTPLWDDDGRVYMAHAWAASRASTHSIISVVELSADAMSVISDEVLVYDGHGVNKIIEGPKFYKRNGYYYIFAPAGGVATGWQVVLRSENIYGPYECRTVMSSGDSGINGPHQGGWVEDIEGDSWFVHFQDRAAYGRIAHLQPMFWGEDNWCVIGEDSDNDGCGTPVQRWKKPASRVASEICEPATSDDFNSAELGLQWQWHANYQSWWAMPFPGIGALRLHCIEYVEGWRNLWDTTSLLLQKFPAPQFTASTKMKVTLNEGERVGLLVMGMDYGSVEVAKIDGAVVVRQIECNDAEGGVAERVNESVTLEGVEIKEGAGLDIWFRCTVEPSSDTTVIKGGAKCRFEYSLNGSKYRAIGESFEARAGKWIGAKVGCYATSDRRQKDRGWGDLDYFTVKK